ncbi:MAG: SDR family oxidoreductase [Pseudomonadota bacterium]
MKRLDQKNAVITGGTTGLGFETARRYLEEGARVLVTGRNADKVEYAVEQLGHNAFGIASDATDVSDCARLAEKAHEVFGGRVDILFANAGIGVVAPIDQVNEELYAYQFDLNVKGVFFTVQSILPLMPDGSSVIMTSSSVNAKGAPASTLYFASKAAVRSFARTMGAELGSRSIRVNTISPGIVPTQFFANSNVGAGAYDQFADTLVHLTPLGRVGSPIDIANAAVYLGSDESSFVTATDLIVDGGWASVLPKAIESTVSMAGHVRF